MNKYLLIISALFISATSLFAGIDMQAHLATDEALAAYTDYIDRQEEYYTDDCCYAYLLALTGDELFGRLNSLMGSTCKLGNGAFDYGTLRYAYVGVDRDLNTPGNLIGYYDGKSINATWDGGDTWNREHTWPQSKGAKKTIPMGFDMQSVRPTNKSVNSSRGNTAYGSGANFYDPDEITIVHSSYRKENLGTYRGDAARVILYDYLVYGSAGGHKNNLYNGNAQLLSKLGSYGVFESLHVLLTWHMQDPPSLTEMVRNDGAQDYQGNRNPVIDYPELATQLFLGQSAITCYTVECQGVVSMWPNHKYTLSEGFIAYLTLADGSHPADINITGAQYNYDATNGRLTVSAVSDAMTISVKGTAVEDVACNSSASIYTIAGTLVATVASADLATAIKVLAPGLYMVRQGKKTTKVIR